MKWYAVLTALAIVVMARPSAAQIPSINEAFQESYGAEASSDFDAAIKAMEKIGPDLAGNYMVQLRLGWLNYRAKNYRKSIEHYTKATQSQPMAIEPLLGLMLPQMANNMNEEAMRTAQMILRQDPNNYTALARTAWLKYIKGDYRMAATTYKKLVTLYPTDTEMLVGLGWALKLSGDTKEADNCFRRVLLLSPNNALATEGLSGGKSPPRNGR